LNVTDPERALHVTEPVPVVPAEAAPTPTMVLIKATGKPMAAMPIITLRKRTIVSSWLACWSE